MATNYPLTPGSLASNCYPDKPQSLYNEMFAQGFVQLEIQGVVLSATEPDPDDRDKLWIELDASSNPVRHWIFANGLWRWPHEVPAAPNSHERRLWVGTEAELETYDGGSAGTVSDVSGPFWEVDHDFDQRIPIGPGTLPDSGTVIAVGDEGGSDETTLTTDQMPEHSHLMFEEANSATGLSGSSNAANKSATTTTNIDDDNDYNIGTSGLEENFPATAGKTSDVGGGSTHDNMPPYRGVFLIKRTERIFRTV